MKWFQSLYESLFNNDKGFAGRKVTAAVCTLAVIAADIVYMCKPTEVFISIFIDFIIVHLCAVGFFLGLVTIGNIIELKNGKSKDNGTA